MELKEGALVVNRFRLTRLLGKGGMGDVWLAQHTGLDIPCAVKFIHAESADNPEVRERFEREAKAAAALRSPNVVQILDYGVADGNVPYLAMEYLEGEVLSVRLRRRGRLDAVETYRIINGVGRALTRAHVAGIVHRDLKPENVVLVPDEDGEIAKVLDFGVAKLTTQLDSNTRTGALLGTPYYMSPEQAQGIRAVDSRADLWSLAVVAFRCVTGQLPFKSDALGDLLIRIVTQAPPVPSHVCPGLPASFDRWWARASQRDPDHRYQSAKELCDGLAMALGLSVPAGGFQASVSDLLPPGPMQQTVAMPEMNTPMPSGAPVGTPPPPFPSGPGALPWRQSQGDPAAFSHPAPLAYQPVQTPQPFGDSQASASVVGMATGNPVAVRKGMKPSVLLAAFGVVLIGVGIGAYKLREASTANSGSANSGSANTGTANSSLATAGTADSSLATAGSADPRAPSTVETSPVLPQIAPSVVLSSLPLPPATATAKATAKATVAVTPSSTPPRPRPVPTSPSKLGAGF